MGGRIALVGSTGGTGFGVLRVQGPGRPVQLLVLGGGGCGRRSPRNGVDMAAVKEASTRLGVGADISLWDWGPAGSSRLSTSSHPATAEKSRKPYGSEAQ